jgi:DNA repair protein RadC
MLPREKFLQNGIDVLSDIELIEILVGSGIKGSSYKKISKSVMSVLKKSVKEDSNITLDSLLEVEGIGEVTAMRIVCGIELGKRLHGIFDSETVRVTQSSDAYEVFKDLKTLKKERVDMLSLNSRFECIDRETIAIGSLNCASLLPRDVLYPAIKNNAAFVVLAHNHPSGDSTPSEEDVLLTKRIVDSLELIGIQLLDHVIIGSKGWSCVPM